MEQTHKASFFSLGLVRGVIGFIIGLLFGVALTSAIRLAMGLPVSEAGGYGLSQPAWVSGAITAVIGFMLAQGVMSDWLKSAKGEDIPDHPQDAFSHGWARYLSACYDHKVIGIQYGVTSLIVFLTAGFFALIFRTQLALNSDILGLRNYNTIMTLHGIVMIGGILLGVAAISNYLVPLMIGANDMAFPRLNAFAYWINVPAVLILLASLFFGGLETGWTGYPPLSTRGPLGMDMFFLGVYFIGLSSILGSLNIITTIIRMRAKGMNYFRMPILVWAAWATAIIGLTATQLIGLSFQMVLFERIFGMSFFQGEAGGNPILFQHLFWFYSHPAVYVFVLVGLGTISEILPVFARKPLFGYRWVALSSFGIALVGFLVWAHHMFTSGMAPYLRIPFMYTTLLVAIPTGVKFFSWIATIWGGKLSFETPMLFALGAISIFLLGGLSGPPNATVSTDLHLQDTYWIVGHFHATMFGGYVCPFFAALYYWFPKYTGRMYNEKLGKLHFFLMLPAFYVQSLAQMQIGLLGMRRRIGLWDPDLMFGVQQWAITIAGFVIGISVLIAVINLAYSAARGRVAVANPWGSRSPEFQIASPIPQHNYDTPFEVVGEPYDYGLAGSAYVSIDKERYHPAEPPAAPAAPVAAPVGTD